VNNKLLFPVVAVAFMTVGTLDALAQTSMTGGGTLTFGQNSPEIVELADGRSLLRTSNSGVYVADDPTGPFHLATQDCRVLWSWPTTVALRSIEATAIASTPMATSGGFRIRTI